MLIQLLRTVRLGIKSLLLHTARSILTMLGIVFGVASVIAMLAVGEGASMEQQKGLKRLGSSNIIITSIKPVIAQQDKGSQREYTSSYGITQLDAKRILASVPGVKRVVPVRKHRQKASYFRNRQEIEIIGTYPEYRKSRSLRLQGGRFICENDLLKHDNICVISENLARKLFVFHSPYREVLRIGDRSFKVVGVIDSDSEGGDDGADFRLAAYIPFSTFNSVFGDILHQANDGEFKQERIEVHELTIESATIDDVEPIANATKHLLEHGHEHVDYEINVPLKQLREIRRTKRMFTIVLGCIAAISLLVGGIGIMNIMLATVTERTREIGVRRALGARKRDIITQFLVETVVLSVLGGLIGVIIGVIIPLQISQFTNVNTVITFWSLAVAFSVSAFTGVIFGLYPAIRAANLDPIDALRHE